MRIALMGPYHPQTGGVQVYCKMLAKGLSERGHDVTVISYPGAAPYNGESVVTVKAPPVKGLRGTSFIIGAAMKAVRGYDLILAQYYTTSGLASFLAWVTSLGRVRYMITFHGSDVRPILPRFLWRSLAKAVLSRSKAVITVSEWLKKEVEELGAEVKAVIPGAVPRDLYKSLPSKEDAKDRLKLRDRVVLSVGSLKRPKRFDLIPLIAERVDADFLIIGRGSFKGSSRVRLVGEVPYEKIPLYYRAADVLLHPVDWEGYGLVALESLAAGTPVVATDVGGLREVIKHGVTGFLVKPHDIERYAEYLNLILGDEKLAREMGSEGRKTALKRDWSDVVDEYEEVIREAMS